MELSYYPNKYKPYLINGIVNPMFWRYKNAIEKFVKEMKLEPIDAEIIQKRSIELTQVHIDPPWWKYGGMKIPHLHFNDHTYLLKDEQWRDFSKILIKNFQEKLNRVNGISFDGAQEISNSLESVH